MYSNTNLSNMSLKTSLRNAWNACSAPEKAGHDCDPCDVGGTRGGLLTKNKEALNKRLAGLKRGCNQENKGHRPRYRWNQDRCGIGDGVLVQQCVKTAVKTVDAAGQLL